MARAAAHSSANAASVVSQRHTASPRSPPVAQNGHTSALNPQDGFTFGAPKSGHVQICSRGTRWSSQIARPYVRCCQKSYS